MIVDKITYDNAILYCHNIVNKDNVNIDVMKLKAALSYYDDMMMRNIDNIYSDISVLLYCIRLAIDKSDITEKQLKRLNMWMHGKTEKEIANELGVSEVTIHNSLVQTCKKIANNLKGVIGIWF